MQESVQLIVWRNCAVLQTLNTQVEAALQSGLNFKDRFTTTSRKRLLVVAADGDAGELWMACVLHCQVTSADAACRTGRGCWACTALYPEHAQALRKHYVAAACTTSADTSSCPAFASLLAADAEPLEEVEEDLEEQAAQQQQQYVQQDQQQQQQEHHEQGQQQQHDPHIQQQQAAAANGKRGPSALGLQLHVGSQMETGEWKSGGVWVKKEKKAEVVPSNLQVIPADDLVKVLATLHGTFTALSWVGLSSTPVLHTGHSYSLLTDRFTTLTLYLQQWPPAAA